MSILSEIPEFTWISDSYTDHQGWLLLRWEIGSSFCSGGHRCEEASRCWDLHLQWLDDAHEEGTLIFNFDFVKFLSLVFALRLRSSIGLVKSMQPAISNPASADSVISSKTDPNLCFAMHAHSSISFSGLNVESNAADHQDWCFSNGSYGRVASIVS
ncbi:Zinc finger protein CONSTANS-LIKE 10 [Camellia lanceoleosa]|uniref:Zinc finger protein CONSTANS-LIKE 10 n=1 Tax=Camellia lanceoleosa TaxID=1840588 RepID=A0ACC0FX23_9ERIC|nr:Zinc finger protein CONSTANS-LIKE 10 [Camellia lanceoleosa]